MGLCVIGACASYTVAFHAVRRKAIQNVSRQHDIALQMIDDDYYLAPTLKRIQHKITSRSISTQQQTNELLIDGLAASHLGLDPSKNTRHPPMVYHENYSFDNWPASHTFPMDKFHMTAQSLLNDIDENGEPLVSSFEDFYKPLNFDQFPTSILSPPIDESFLDAFLNGQLSSEECRLIGFREHTSRPEVIERTVLEVAGTILTAQLALKYGLASHLAGGTHHAEYGRGKGFTILNDLACVARLMTWSEEGADKTHDNLDLMRELYRGNSSVSVERVLVVDCDVHQGDGTATFHNTNAGGLNGKLFTLDLHAASNYPHPKEKCTYDVPLPDECTDEQYMEALVESLEKAIRDVEPQLVLYNAGVDPYEHDKLGRLSLTWEGLQQRDHFVISTCVDAGIPVACTVGGGYERDIRQLGKRHALVHRVCAKIWREKQLFNANRWNTL
jgi:acetoin utilization deacetylase AcuC-like enzyme